jgi:hypothetical protein
MQHFLSIGDSTRAFKTLLLMDLDASVPVPAKHAGDYLRLAELVKSLNMETAWQDHRKPTHPMTFGETNTLLKGLIATRRNLLISPEHSKDIAEICPRCVQNSSIPFGRPQRRAFVARVLLASLM